MESLREMQDRFEIFQENFEYCLGHDEFIKQLVKSVKNLETEVAELKRQLKEQA